MSTRIGALGLATLIACGNAVPAAPPAPLPPTALPTSDSAPIVPVTDAAAAAAPLITRGRGPGFATPRPWVSFYGSAAQMGDLAKVAATYRIINIDADPGASNFTDAQLKVLKAGGKNRVLSYLNVGSCELSRDYWSKAPAGFVGCGPNRAAHLGTYEGYPDETWMDPSNADYRRLIVEHVAPRLVLKLLSRYRTKTFRFM